MTETHDQTPFPQQSFQYSAHDQDSCIPTKFMPQSQNSFLFMWSIHTCMNASIQQRDFWYPWPTLASSHRSAGLCSVQSEREAKEQYMKTIICFTVEHTCSAVFPCKRSPLWFNWQSFWYKTTLSSTSIISSYNTSGTTILYMYRNHLSILTKINVKTLQSTCDLFVLCHAKVWFHSWLTRSNILGLDWFPMWSKSLKPLVITSATLSPLRSSNAFVATVVPIRIHSILEPSINSSLAREMWSSCLHMHIQTYIQ